MNRIVILSLAMLLIIKIVSVACAEPDSKYNEIDEEPKEANNVLIPREGTAMPIDYDSNVTSCDNVNEPITINYDNCNHSNSTTEDDCCAVAPAEPDNQATDACATDTVPTNTDSSDNSRLPTDYATSSDIAPTCSASAVDHDEMCEGVASKKYNGKELSSDSPEHFATDKYTDEIFEFRASPALCDIEDQRHKTSSQPDNEKRTNLTIFISLIVALNIIIIAAIVYFFYYKRTRSPNSSDMGISTGYQQPQHYQHYFGNRPVNPSFYPQLKPYNP